MTTAVLWYRSYRRGRYGGWDGAVDALALILVAMTPGTAMAGSGLLIARGQIRSLYGSPRGKLLHAAAGSACLALGLLLSTAPADRAVLRLLLVTLVLFTFAAFRPGRAGPGRRGRTHPTRPGRPRR